MFNGHISHMISMQDENKAFFTNLLAESDQTTTAHLLSLLPACPDSPATTESNRQVTVGRCVDNGVVQKNYTFWPSLMSIAFTHAPHIHVGIVQAHAMVPKRSAC